MSVKVKICTECNNEIPENNQICSFCNTETQQRTTYTFNATNGVLGIGIRGLANVFKTEVILNEDDTIEVRKYKGRYEHSLKQKKYWKISKRDIKSVKMERKPQISLMLVSAVFLLAGIVLNPLYFIFLALTCFGMIKKSVVLQMECGTDIDFYIGKDTATAESFIQELGTNIGNIRKGGILKKGWFYILILLCLILLLVFAELGNESISNDVEKVGIEESANVKELEEAESSSQALSEADNALATAKTIVESELKAIEESYEFQQKAINNNISIEMLYRRSEAYVGKEVYFSGSVLQAIYNENDPRKVQLRVEVVTESENDVVYVLHTLGEDDLRILEDDWVDIYGIYNDLITYESVSGQSITIPSIETKYLYSSASMSEEYIPSAEYEIALNKTRGSFVNNQGDEISFPIDTEPNYYCLSEVKKYQSNIYATYGPDLGWDESESPVFYKLVIFENNSIVVYDETTQSYCYYEPKDKSQ